MAATSYEVMRTAAAEIGTIEVPAGSNRVPYWSVYPAWNGSPWCAAFIQWCFKQHGMWYPASLPYYVPSFVQKAKADGTWLDKTAAPRIGDFVVYGYDGYTHIGLLERALSDGRIQTIEGNTSSSSTGSQNNGGGVYRRIRSRSWVRGFIRPREYSNVSTAPAPTGTKWQRTDVVAMQKLLEATADGRWGAGTQTRAQAFRAVASVAIAHTTTQLRLVQGIVDVTVDGSYGPKTRSAVIANTKAFQKILKVSQDGSWGPATDRAYVAFHKEWRGR